MHAGRHTCLHTRLVSRRNENSHVIYSANISSSKSGMREGEETGEKVRRNSKIQRTR